MPTYLDYLKQMVEINSFTKNPEGINHLGQVTAGIFSTLGFKAEHISSIRPDYGRHVVLTRHGRSGRRIGLVSHLDTVFPPEEEVRNDFAWRREGDRIYGPGTVDIKGGTVLIYMVLAALQAFAPALLADTTWVILLDASEEASAEDFGQLCRDRLERSDTLACLVFEGGFQEDDEFWVVRTRKGMAVYEITVEGKAAHAGTRHEHGANAIVQLADTITRAAAITDYGNRLTVNVGKVNGGTVTNRVPHQADAVLEMRTFDQSIFEAAMSSIEALSDEIGVRSEKGGYSCRVDVKLKRKTSPWPANDATDRLIATWQKAGESLGFRVLPEERGGLSDGNHFWQHLPTLDGLGVAGGNAHCSERSSDGSKDQEYCLVSSFVPKALLNIMGIMELANADK
jgi:glutamate carboxypeptidase